MSSEITKMYRVTDDKTEVIEQYPVTITNAVYDNLNNQFLNETIADLMSSSNLENEIASLRNELTTLQNELITYKNKKQFKGVLLSKTTDQNVIKGTSAQVTFDTTQYDTNTFFDAQVDNTKIVIPSGVKKVRLSGSVIWNNINDGVNHLKGMYIIKNNTEGVGAGYLRLNSTSNSPMQISTAIIDVVEGDYFTLSVANAHTVDMQITGRGYTWFSLEVIDYE